MDKQKFAKMALRTTGAWNIRILTDQINPKYQIIAVKNSITSDTGYLELFCIEPLQLGLPTFFGRWDLRPNTVDIDLLGDAAASSAFKNEMNGYRGHHTRVISDSPRIYGIAIQTPSEHVFSGTIELNIGLGVLVQDSFTVQDSAQAYVIPAAG